MNIIPILEIISLLIIISMGNMVILFRLLFGKREFNLMKLFKKLSDHFRNEKFRQNMPYGMDSEDIDQFKSTLCEEHEVARMKYDETNNTDFADIAIDCLVTINQLERLKLRMALKNKL
ncbi:MAG: hypothetical protein GF329_06900 [Candidatus Lokiarchaeota archaeon]|nr:hypothetical protein [Candidatus Lokiarchaeota archaeon]